MDLYLAKPVTRQALSHAIDQFKRREEEEEEEGKAVVLSSPTREDDRCPMRRC